MSDEIGDHNQLPVWDDYLLKVPVSVDVTWTDSAGEVHKDSLLEGQWVSIEDPCDALLFAQAYLDATGTGYLTKGYEVASFGAMRAACGQPSANTVLGESTGQPHPPAAPPPPVPHASGPDGEITSPDDTTPEGVAAPDAGATVEAQGPTGIGRTDGRPLEQQYHDPQQPLSDGGVVDQLANQGVPATDLGAELDRIQKNQPTPGLPHYDFGRNDVRHPVTAVDPVDLFGGAFFLQQVDLGIRSPRVPLQIVRIYRSGAPYYGPWGYGWDHSYNVYLRPLAAGDIAVWTGQLAEDVYRLLPDGMTFQPPLGIFKKLIYEPARGLVGDRHVVEDRTGLRQIFERPAGWPIADRVPMVRIEDRHGVGHDLTYDADGLLRQVSDEAGRALHFEYGACGLVERAYDNTGRAVRYIHDNDVEHLVAVIGPPTIEAPEGPATTYEYDKTEWHPALCHNLTRIVDPDGRTVVMNEYGKEPGNDDFARVVTQHFGCSRADFSATVLQEVPRVGSAINLPVVRTEVLVDGEYRVYTFNFRGDLLDERLRLIRDGSYRLWARVFQYDEHGNRILEREPDGLSLSRVYDHTHADPWARGNLLQMSREAGPAAAVPARIVLRAAYESRYQLVKWIRDEAGATTTFGYDYETRVGGEADLVLLEYPAVTLADGTVQRAREHFTYDTRGELIRQATDTGRVFEYHYYASGPAVGYLSEVVRDPVGLALRESYSYDAWGNGTSLTDGNGHETRIEWDAAGLLRRFALPASSGQAPEYRYAYDRSGQLTEVRSPRGALDDGVIVDDYIVDTFDYDALGQLRGGVRAANTAARNPSSYRYDAHGRPVGVTDALGRTTELRYDERGCVLEERLGDGGTDVRVTKYLYDRNGNRTATVEPDGRRTDFTYDPWGRGMTMLWPAVAGVRTETRFAFGKRDLLERIEIVGVPRPGAAAAALFASQLRYDERQRPIAAVRDGHDVTLSWSADDEVETQNDVAGQALSYGYDAAGRLEHITDAMGNVIRYHCDAADQLLSVRCEEVRADGDGPDIATTIYGYDERGNSVSVTDPLGNIASVAYDERGLTVQTTDALGQRIGQDYDGLGQLVRRRALDQGGLSLSWDHDPGGRMVRYRDPLGAETRFQYDGFDGLVRVDYPDQSHHDLAYHADGELANETTPSRTSIAYARREDGEVVGITFVPGPGVAATDPIGFERDGLGRVTRASEGPAIVEHEYDALGRLVAETAQGRRIEVAYDDPAATMTLTYPDTRQDRVRFDPLRRPAATDLVRAGATGSTGALAVGSTIASYTYDGLARLAGRKLFSGVTSTYRYDASQRLVAIAHKDHAGQSVSELGYVYDAVGRRRVLEAGPAPAGNAWFRYDALSRLVEHRAGLALPVGALPTRQADADAYVAALGTAPQAAVAQQYELDDGDVRLTWRRLDSTGTTLAKYTRNTLAQVTRIDVTLPSHVTTSAYYVFDADGNRRTDATRAFVYDALGRLVEVRDAGSGALLLVQRFDPFGRLVEWSDGGAAGERLVYLGNRCLQVDDPASTPLRQLAVGAVNHEVPVLSSGSNRWTVQDDRWSRLALGAEDGSLLERYAFDPFGGPTAWDAAGTTERPVSAALLPPVFAGLTHLPPGIYGGRARAYDPQHGQFLQRDPEGYTDSPCLYAYADDNPVDNLDADATFVETAWDVFSLGLGVYSAHSDYRDGKWGWFALDCVGVVLDTAAVLLPFVPGGVGVGIKAFRAGHAAVTVGENAWRSGRIVVGGIGISERAGRAAFRAETIIRGAQRIDQAANVGQGFYQSYQQFDKGNYLEGMLRLGMAGVGARGVVAKWHGIPFVQRPLHWRELQDYGAGIVYPRYGQMPWRAFGNNLALLRNPRTQYRLQNLFWDDRAYGNVSRQYWRGNACGLSLQHTWVMNSTASAPRALRNAGLNLIEIPGRLNSWIGDNAWRNGAFRLQVTTFAGIAGASGYATTRELMNQFTSSPPELRLGTK